MRNEKLITARIERGWTQEKAAEKIGVSRVAYARWEEKNVIPHLSTISMVCEAFKMTPEQLGFRKATNAPVRISSSRMELTQEPTVVAVSSATDMFSIGILALSLAQQQHHWTSEELQARTEQEMRRLEMMQRKQQNGAITRRQALSFLASLPVAYLGFSQMSSQTTLPAEEALSLYVSSVPACWRLFFEGELPRIEELLPTYLSHLTPLAQQSSSYQKCAASLLSQTHQLASLLVLEREDFGTSLFHCKQAVLYAELAEDANVRVGAAVRQANMLYYRKRDAQIVQTYQEVLPFIEKSSPLMRGRAYSGLSAALSSIGLEQEALRYMGLAHDTFPDHPEDDPGFLFTHTTHYILYLNDTLTHLNFQQAQYAWDAITKAAEYVPDTLSPRRIELLNHQTLASVALGDLEQSCMYFESATTSGKKLGSDLYLTGASEIYQNMLAKWPHERRVKELADLL